MSKTCLPISPAYEIINKKPDFCVGWYSIATGFRKVPGNVCQGGINIISLILGIDKGP